VQQHQRISIAITTKQPQHGQLQQEQPKSSAGKLSAYSENRSKANDDACKNNNAENTAESCT